MVSAMDASGARLFDDDLITGIRTRCIEGLPGMTGGRVPTHAKSNPIKLFWLHDFLNI